MNSRYIVPSVDGTFFLDYTNLQVSACSVPQSLQIFWKAVITRMESEQELYRNTAPIHPQLLLTLMQQSKIAVSAWGSNTQNFGFISYETSEPWERS